MFKRWLSLIPDKSALIIGPRRSGKTTYFKAQHPNFNYITLDDFDDWVLAKRDPKGFVMTLGKQAIIDEIQRLPELTIAVKYALDNQWALFFMTSSSSIGLLDTAAAILAGRIYLYAVEIKATTKPGAKDFRNLKEFGKKMNLDTKLFLFYLGTEYY